MTFEKLPKNVKFPGMETDILEFWKKNGIFEKSLEMNKNKEAFIFYDGPPFATGLPHFGHFLPSSIKDIVPRYQTMKGRYVERRWGWDCHGLPVENLIEKELNLNGKRDILAYGIGNFNEACRASVLRYTAEWEKTVIRMGRWVDFRNSYRTMDPDYMESIWWVFNELWNKKLIYEGQRVLPYCPRCTTPLSNFETNQGYRDVQDPAITVAFKLLDQKNTYILAWTTTPWTLPSNVALAVGRDIGYVKVRDSDKFYILAESLLPRYYKDVSKVTIEEHFNGEKLAGLKYEPLFPYFKDLAKENAFRVVTGHHVTIETGTGVVHIAPGFGEDDAEIGKAMKLPSVCPVDAEGRFTDEITDYKGIKVKDADKAIIKRLKDEKKLVKHETYQHSYPHCWRCDEPLIYRSIASWFVDIQAVKAGMLKANSKINWIPDHLKEGRFGKWLEQAIDWSISRNRYWGSPIPVWKCEECGGNKCIGSIEELEKLGGEKVTDLHRHHIDHIVIKCKKCGGTMKRIEEVLDCWFESGAMPYAQNHYPFENKDKFGRSFPADFIAEGLDQTRGWFYTLVVLGAALFDKNAFRNVVVNGLVLAEDGRKMSKRLKNYPEVDYIFDKYGSDAVRLFLMNSAAVRAGELLFSEAGVQDVLKSFHLPLWNSYSFFITYALVDNWDPEKDAAVKFDNPLDLWLISYTENLAAVVDESLSGYDFGKAIKELYKYLDLLTNWYIRRSRRRFWKSEDDLDKKQAYSALYNALIKFVTLAAPIAPFITDTIYRNLKIPSMKESVHLCDYPAESRSLRNLELEKEMELVLDAVEMGRSLRSKTGINLRRPLNAVFMVTRNAAERKLLQKMEQIIKEELNVKSVVYETDEGKLVTLSSKANFKLLGKKLGKDMKPVADIVAGFGGPELKDLEVNGSITVKLDGRKYGLSKEEVIIERTEREGLTVMNSGSLTIALDTNLTPELIDEGIAREFIRNVQNMRKDLNLEVTDKIKVIYSAPEPIVAAVKKWEKVIRDETLAVSVGISDKAPSEVEIDEQKVMLGIEKSTAKR